MKIKQLSETTAGAVASVAMPLGSTHKRTEEAANPAQQAAIAISMKKAGKKPKKLKEDEREFVEKDPRSYNDDDFYAFDPETKVIKGTWSHKSVGRRHSEYVAQEKGWKVVSGMRAKSLGLLVKKRVKDMSEDSEQPNPDAKKNVKSAEEIIRALRPDLPPDWKYTPPADSEPKPKPDKKQLRKDIKDIGKEIYKENISEGQVGNIMRGMLEAHISEEELLLAPGQGIKFKTELMPKRTDHEVEMARNQLRVAAQSAKRIYQNIEDLSEIQGLDGWVQAKITKASDYLDAVNNYIEGKKQMLEIQDEVDEQVAGDQIDQALTAQYNTPQMKAQSQAIDQAFASGDEKEFQRLGIQSPQQIERDYQTMLGKEKEQDAALMRNPKLTPSARPVQRYNPKGVPIRETDIEEAHKLSAREKFKRSLKRAGYDPDAGANRLLNLIARQAEERKEFERKQKEQDSEFYGKRKGVAEAESQQLSVNQLAMISDEALDNAYGYGRSSPGNTFGWQANLMSAAYAKRMIDAGVTDIEKIADAIHKGWNVTAQKFVQDPDQFDDTEKLRQAGKLDAKLAQRAKLMRIGYFELDNDEQEKDRVVARALLQAIRGDQGVAKGPLKEFAPNGGDDNYDRKIYFAVQEPDEHYSTYALNPNTIDTDELKARFGKKLWAKGPFMDLDDAHEAIWAHIEKNKGMAEGGFDIPEIPRAPQPKPDPKNKTVDEDWQKTNRRDKTSGMSRKAVKQYRRENPGSKLQTAVTTKPSKLKKGSKSAKRRKSFCSRMRGMKKSRTSAKTARDPNSNINKALRRWNCESVEELRNLVMLAEQKIAMLKEEQGLEENLHKWFKEKWVRFGPDGKIRGDCARGDDSEGKPKCLPQSKAQSLGKKGRASAAARKRREDPNPERSGPAINVATKKKSNEGVAEGSRKAWARHNNLVDLEKPLAGLEAEFNDFLRTHDPEERAKYQQGVKQRIKTKPMAGPKEKLPEQGVAKGGDDRKDTVRMPPEMTGRDPSKPYADIGPYTISMRGDDATTQQDARHLGTVLSSVPNPLTKAAGIAMRYAGQYDKLPTGEKVARAMDSAGNPDYISRHLQNKKTVKEQVVVEGHEMCPECGGAMYSEEMINEKKDACYYKVKSRYKVWPSAYASGALVKCRNKGAKNWGNKSK